MTVIRISSQAADVLREMQGPRSVLRLFGRRVDPVLIDRLRGIGDVLAAPALVPLLIGADQTTSDQLTGTIAALMSACPVADLPELDHACRTLGAYDIVDWTAWRDLEPADVRALASSLTRDAEHVLGITSFHRSGYVRHAAVDELDGIESGDELPYLLLRLNDWVPPVADAARDAVLRRIQPRWVADWVASLPIIAYLRTATRRTHDAIIDSVFALLREADHGQELRTALQSPDRATRRLTYELARASAAMSMPEVIRLALADADPLIRIDAIRDGLPALDDAAIRALLPDLDANPFMPVRRAGLLVAAARFPSETASRAERALMDRHAAVRELARFQLRQVDSGRSFAVIYQDALARSSTSAGLVAALAGLGETGDRSSGALVEPYVRDGRPSVRQTAIRALGRLAADSHSDVFLGALSDPSPRVAREARMALTASSTTVDLDALRRVIQSASFRHGPIEALMLGRSLGKWRNLVLLLEGAIHAELEVADPARQQLLVWLQRINRSSVPPSATDLAEIDAVLSRTRFSIDDTIRREIVAALDVWR